MASIIHPPATLKLKDCKDANKAWKQFKQAWDLYEIASGTAEKGEGIRLATFLHVAGQDAIEKYNSFQWEAEDDKNMINKVIEKFEMDCKSTTNVFLERYNFYNRKQLSEETYDQYVTQLRILSATCEFSNINEILRDQFMFNIRDKKTVSKLIDNGQTKVDDFTFEKAIGIAKSLEISRNRNIEKSSCDEILKINVEKKQKYKKYNDNNKKSLCKKCGNKHEFGIKFCPANGKTCNSCHKPNHFSKMCFFKKGKSVFTASTDNSEDNSLEISSESVSDMEFI